MKIKPTKFCPDKPLEGQKISTCDSLLIILGQSAIKKKIIQIKKFHIDNSSICVADKYGKNICVPGYHIVASSTCGKILICLREPWNSHDRYAVAIDKDIQALGTTRQGKLHVAWRE